MVIVISPSERPVVRAAAVRIFVTLWRRVLSLVVSPIRQAAQKRVLRRCPTGAFRTALSHERMRPSVSLPAEKRFEVEASGGLSLRAGGLERSAGTSGASDGPP